MWDFFVSFRCWGKSEAIGADDASGMQDTVVAYTAVMIDGCARIEDTMTTYAGSGTDSGMRMQGSAVADYHSIAYVGKGGYVDVFSHLGCGGYVGQRVDTLQLRFALFVERK